MEEYYYFGVRGL